MIKGYSADVFKSIVDRFIGLVNKAEKENKPYTYALHYYGVSGILEVWKIDVKNGNCIKEQGIFLNPEIFDFLDKEEAELRMPEKKEEIYK